MKGIIKIDSGTPLRRVSGMLLDLRRSGGGPFCPEELQGTHGSMNDPLTFA